MSEDLKNRTPNLDKIVRKMESSGFKFDRFELSCEDPCLPVDVEWNYKDLVHVGFVHHHMARQYIYTGDHVYTTIDLQEILGVTVPQSTTFYSTEENHMIVHTTLFLYVICVELIFEQVGDMMTKTTTRYAVGVKSPILRMFSPIISFALKRNWGKFTKDDRPLRVRRGELRKMGYSINDVSPIDLRKTLDIFERGIILPKEDPDEKIYEFIVSENIPHTRLAGDSDHLGLQIRFELETIQIFPRLCPHRGGVLNVNCSNGAIAECPWHGRKFHALANIKNDGSAQSFESTFFKCDYSDNKLIIHTIPNLKLADNVCWTTKWKEVAEEVAKS